MELKLENKVIIVTGGASGIGRSIAGNLVTEGAQVCVLDNNRSYSDETIFYIRTELTSHEECDSAVNDIIQKFGKIDGLVNNAGINDGVGLENGSHQKFLESIDKNVGHYQTMTELSLPFLKKTNGVMVNICSKTALTGQGETSGYAAANGMRIALTKQWAKTFSPFGIRVNAVIVSECWTPLYKWWINQQNNPEEKLEEINAKIPLGNRMTSTEEIASMVLFLLSQKSAGINGELLHVDGGYVHLDRAINPRQNLPTKF